MKYAIAVLLLICNALAQEMTDLRLKDLSGQTHSISEYRGNIVVLNFWATWCTPCKDEMPIFVEADKRYRDRGVIVVAASLDDSATRIYVSKFVHSYKMKFPVLLGATADDMHRVGLGDAVPSTIFLDPQGHVAGKILGAAKKKDVLERIERLLGNHDGQKPEAGDR
jgi:thiol-disulfide isomerase/thioredoxin